jgi:HlyD family secretion protein
MVKKVIFFLTFLFLLPSCKDKVQLIKPQLASISESIYASGLVKSKNQYQAFAAVNGIINNVYVKEGDTIKKGQALLSIVNKTQQLNKENAQLSADFADLNANRGKLNEAKLLIDLALSKMKNDSVIYFRQLSLWQQQIGSRMDLDQKELAYQNTKTAYFSAVVRFNDLKRQLDFNEKQANKNLRISRNLVSDYILRSEINGIVYSLIKSKGETVNTQSAIATIGDDKRFILEMQVDEYDILKIRKNMPVQVTLNSYKGKVFEAQVTKIIPLMNERSKTFVVEAEFVRQPDVLYPNISFEANIVLQTKEKAMIIPRQYLLNDSTVIKKNGKKVIVKTGLKDYQKAEILSGIGLDDELIDPVK